MSSLFAILKNFTNYFSVHHWKQTLNVTETASTFVLVLEPNTQNKHSVKFWMKLLLSSLPDNNFLALDSELVVSPQLDFSLKKEQDKWTLQFYETNN